MKKIWQKSLASMVSAALCLTAFVGCLTVNAATTYNGKITSDGVAVETTATEATVKLTISADVDMAAAGITVSTDFGALTNVSVPTENEVLYKIDPPADGGFNLANGTVIVEAKDQKDYPFNNAEVTLTFTKNKELTLNENDSFAVNVTPLKNSTIPAATYNEDEIYFTVDVINITVNASTPTCEHTNATKVFKEKTATAFVYTCSCPDCDVADWEEQIAIGEDFTGAVTTKKNIDPTNDISMTFRFETANIGDYTDYIAVIEKETYEKNAEISTISTDYVLSYDTKTSGYYSFKYPGIAPYEMNNSVSCYLYGKNAENQMIKLGAVENYSVNAYVKTILSNYATNNSASVVKLKKALVDLLNYGARSQTLAKFNVANLANANLTETEVAYGTLESEYCTPDGTTWSTIPTAQGELEGATDANRVTVARNLNPAEKVYLQFILKTYAADISQYSVKFDYFDIKGNAVSTDILPCTDVGYVRSTDNAFVCEFDKAPISTFDYPVKATFYCGDVPVYEDIYSIESYIKTYCKFASNSNVNYANIGKFVQSIYAHGRSMANAVNVTPYMDTLG